MSVQVREISNGWQYSENETGITATRVFLNYADEGTLIDLPVIGDKYIFANPVNLDMFSNDIETTFATLFLRKIKQKKYGDILESNIYYCYYTNEITDLTQYIRFKSDVDIAKLPITVESGGEYELITSENNKSTTTWKWEGTGEPV